MLSLEVKGVHRKSTTRSLSNKISMLVQALTFSTLLNNYLKLFTIEKIKYFMYDESPRMGVSIHEVKLVRSFFYSIVTERI